MQPSVLLPRAAFIPMPRRAVPCRAMQDTVLAYLWANARTLRIADGPDEVHLGTIAKLELAKHVQMPPRPKL